MGYKSIRTSDISGQDLSDDEVVTVVVKDAGKVFDATKEELASLKPIGNYVELEYRFPDGDVKTVLVSKASFAQLIPDDKLAGFDSHRGRRAGFSPRNGA